jgi:hypothetical protein
MPVAIRSSGGGATTLVATSSATDYTATLPDNSGTVITTGSTGRVIPAAALPAGCILQVLSATKTDTQAFTGAASFSDATGLSITITPTSVTSKFLIMSNLMFGVSAGASGATFRFVRNSTAIDIGDAAGSRPLVTGGYYCGDTAGSASYSSVCGTFLDSPSTISAITYKIQCSSSTAVAVYLNRTYDDRNTSGYDPRGTSTITVMEVAV